jgi:glycosyltransferase involved in cell wall biosynthesis
MTAPPARRILMTTDAVGGVWIYAANLARGLCDLGHEVTLLVMGPAPRREQLAALHAIRGLQVEITDLALEWMDPAGQDVARAQQRLLFVSDRVRPDVVHLNSYREASFDWPVPVLVVAHSCVWSWWEACRAEAPNEARWDHYAAGVASGLMAATAWSAPTTAFRNSIAARYPTRTRGHMIRNGVELPTSSPPKEPFILAAGRLWDEAKNIAELGAIARQLDLPVRAAGESCAPGTLMNEQPLTGVECLGVLSRSQMIAQMQRAAIFVSPALYEPFGLSILEAAACGCALVLSDIPTLRELWAGAALFIEPHDRQALLHALQRMSDDDCLRLKMQHAARIRARRYSLNSMVSAYHDLYHTMTSKSRLDNATSMPAASAEWRT